MKYKLVLAIFISALQSEVLASVKMTAFDDLFGGVFARTRNKVQERKLKELQKQTLFYNQHHKNDFISMRQDLFAHPAIESEERILRNSYQKSRRHILKKKHTKKTKSHRGKHRRLTVTQQRKFDRIHNDFEKNFGKLEDDMSRMLSMPGGGGAVVVAPNQGAGIANAQVVVNSLGTPASMPYAGGKVIPGYNPGDADPKVIVTRMKLPGSRELKKENNKKPGFFI